MTAGKGIVHSEMPEQENGNLEGFQLWINLPASHKMISPAYQEYDAGRIPLEERTGTRIRVITGMTSLGTKGPVIQPLTSPLYLDVTLNADTQFSENLVEEHNAFVYLIKGSVVLDSNALERDQLAVLSKGNSVSLTSGKHGGRFLLVAGKPLGEPVHRAGPFVMNTREELQQAYEDYQSGRI